jgi:hypothetical protein
MTNSFGFGSITSDPWVLQTVGGFSLVFNFLEGLDVKIFRSMLKLPKTHSDALQAEVDALIVKGAICQS